MDDRIMTVPEVASYLKVSKAKLYLLISRNQIPYIRLDRNVRIRESDLLKWLEKQTVNKLFDKGF
jgi:excisionase family DNA binding protein